MALDLPGDSLSYFELKQRANRLAWYLREAGIRVENLIGIAMEPCEETIVAILAALKAGAAFLLLDPSLPQPRFDSMLADARPKLVRHKDGPSPAVLARKSSENLPNAATSENAAYAAYTSGSAGKPKGVVLTHGALVHHSLGASAAYGIRETDRRLQFASIGTDVFIAELFNYFHAAQR